MKSQKTPPGATTAVSSQTHPTTDGTAAAASGGLAAFPEQWREELRENLFQRLIARDAPESPFEVASVAAEKSRAGG